MEQKLEIITEFGFPFNGIRDLNYPSPEVYYVEKFLSGEGKILINIDAALRTGRKEYPGEVVFVHESIGQDCLKVVYFPELGAYFSTHEDSLASLHNSQELREELPEVEAHKRFFGEVFEGHHLGNELRLIYELRFSYKDLRHRTLGYLGEKLKQEPSLLEKLLKVTGKEEIVLGGEKNTLAYPYWTPETKGKFLTRIKMTLR